MKPIQPGERRVVNIAEASFLPFKADGREVPGQSFLQLDDSQPPGVGFHIYRMAPGSSSQPHEHTRPSSFTSSRASSRIMTAMSTGRATSSS